MYKYWPIQPKLILINKNNNLMFSIHYFYFKPLFTNCNFRSIINEIFDLEQNKFFKYIRI